MNQPSSGTTSSSASGNAAVRNYVEMFERVQSRELIANLDTKLETAVTDTGVLLPISVNDCTESGNCYVASPLAHYVEYAAYELSQLRRPSLERAMRKVLSGAGAAFRRADLDRGVVVNNWLLSTNLYPAAWHGEGLGKLLALLIEQYPRHTILFRSLNARQNSGLIAALRHAGARLLASRIVWHYDGADARFMRTPDARRDLRILENGDWEVVENDDLKPADMPAFARLYEQLYIEKYTSLNPRFTVRYLTECHKRGVLRFQGLRDCFTRRWVGVLGTFERDGVLTSPIVGYDTGLPQELGLYRALVALVFRQAVQRRLLLNLSAGVGSFKQLRGGEPCIEYTAVVDSHLPWSRRWPWRFLEWVSNGVGLSLAWRKEVGR